LPAKLVKPATLGADTLEYIPHLPNNALIMQPNVLDPYAARQSDFKNMAAMKALKVRWRSGDLKGVAKITTKKEVKKIDFKKPNSVQQDEKPTPKKPTLEKEKDKKEEAKDKKKEKKDLKKTNRKKDKQKPKPKK
jgi:hypothetical protein